MRVLRGWSIGQRLGAGFGIVGAVLCVFAGAVYSWQQDAARAHRAFNEGVYPRLERALEVERSILRVAIAVRAQLLTPDPEHRARLAASLEEARQSLRLLSATPRMPDGEEMFRAMEPAVTRYLDEIERAGAGAALVNAAAVEEALAQTRAAAAARTRDFIDLQNRKVRAAMEAMDQAQARMAQGFGVAFVVVAALLAALGFLATASVRRPARELTRVAREMQAGRWDAALEYGPQRERERGHTRPPRSELAQIALAFGAAAESLERRERRLAADAAVARSASSSLEKEAVARQALRVMADAAGAVVGAVYWREHDTEALHPIASHGLAAAAAPVLLREGLPGRAADEGQVVTLNDIPADTPLRLNLGIEHVTPRAVVAVPAVIRGEVLAVVVLASLEPFRDDALAFLESAGLQLAIGLQNVRSHEESQRLLAQLREAHEQVQAQNEELQAQNEEIQSQAEELQAQGEELQAQGEELQAQNDELQRHAAELSEADERKNEFLGLLAHELRNPLAAISNSMFILGRPGRTPHEEERGHAVIERQMRHLSRMIDDLLDVTRISRGKLRLQREPVDFVQLVRDGLADARGAIEQAGLVLDTELPAQPVYVEGDRTRLAQVLGNLVSNAVKFTEAGRHVAVAVRRHAEGRVALHVRDSGMGIEAPLLERLFVPFSQGEAGLARGNGGLGLGLALARALVDLHGGSIEARSDGPGKGAEFIATFPVTATKPAERPAAPRVEARPTRRVLIVEDNEDAAETLRIALGFGGHEVEVARSGPEGIDMAHANPPDVILCDLGIPGVDGYEVARRLRADRRLDGTTLVALSGYAASEDRRRTADAGFDHHLAKPVAIETLLELIAAIERRSRAAMPA